MKHIQELYTVQTCENLLVFFNKISAFIPENILKILYFCLVHSKTMYGIEIYANTYPTYLHDAMILNNRILRIIQKKNRSTPVAELYFSYNTLPIDKLFEFRLLLHAYSIIYKSLTLPPLFYDTISLNNKIHTYSTRSSQDAHRVSYFSNSGRRISSNLCAIFWNSLPTNLKTVSTQENFKKHLKVYFLQRLLSSKLSF